MLRNYKKKEPQPIDIQLEDLVGAWVKRPNLVKIQGYVAQHPYDDFGKIIRHLHPLMQSLQLSTVDPVEMAMQSLRKQDNPMAADMLEEFSKKQKRPRKAIEVPEWWNKSNETFAWAILLDKGRDIRNRVDSMKIVLGATDGQPRSYMFWRKDNITQATLTFNMSELKLDFS